MQKIISFILLFLYWTLPSCAQRPIQHDRLQIGINTNTELLGLAYFIRFEGVNIENDTLVINGEQILKKDWHSYGYYVYQKYKAFRSSEKLAQSFTVADHLWLDYILNFLLQVEDFPNAKLTPMIDGKYYIDFSISQDPKEAKENVELFLQGLNDFYVEVNFDQYLLDSEKFYEASLEQIKDNLPNEKFIGVMENFYDRTFANYTLIPSLTIPKGMGFGLKYTMANETNIFNVFGAFEIQEFDNDNELNMGFSNPKRLRELSIHEFGHSFVNPIVDIIDQSKISLTERLFKPIKSDMSNQGYNSWKTCVYEHFVRAGEIMIARKLNDQKGADELLSWYIKGRKFKYIPFIIKELEKLVNGETKSYRDAVEKSLDALAKLK